MGILSGLKARLAGKPTFEQFERKTVGLPPEEAAPLWVDFAKDHEELKPDEATYGYRRAASLYRQIGDIQKYVEQSLNYAKAAERIPDYAVAGDGYRVVAENTKEGAEQYWAKAGENYNKAGQKAEEDRFTTRACDMYSLAAVSYERAGDYQKAIDNYLKSAAPGFKNSLSGLGGLVNALANLDANSKYILCQNLAAWIPALIILAYGKYVSRPRIVRIKRKKRR